jgi:preprotein translocase SecE subunit
MAEKPADKKRRIKNPETFRERLQKGAEAGEKTSTASRIKQTGGQLSKSAGSARARRGASRVFNSRPFKIIIPKYFRGSWQELKLVTWPGWNEGRRLTSAVLIFAIIFGAVIAGVDWVLDKFFHHLFT